MLKHIIELLNFLFKGIGILCAVLLLATMLNIVYDVVMRYIFNDVSIALQELEWHLFATMFLIGISYTIMQDGHVRVDFLYEKFSPEIKALINILGVIFFVWPIAVLIIWYGLDFTFDAITTGERSGDPGGLTHRWIIKMMIPLSFMLVIVASIHMLATNLNIFLYTHASEPIKKYLCFEIPKENEK